MLRDLGSRDSQFIEAVADIRRSLLDIAGVSAKEWTAVLLQGSGTYAVEAVLQTSSPREGARVLVIANGAYGKRMVQVCQVAGIDCDVIRFAEILPVDIEKISAKLSSGVTYTTVCVVHCETSSGVMNDVETIGQLVRKLQPKALYFVDAMSSFGAVPVELSNVDFIVSSANKCLQGVPGFSYAVARKSALEKCEGNSRSLSLDLVEQEKGLASSGQFRFTPPTHTLLAFRQAVKEFYQEGGLAGRQRRAVVSTVSALSSLCTSDTKTTGKSSKLEWPPWDLKSSYQRSLPATSSLASTIRNIKTSPLRNSIRNFPILVKIDNIHQAREGGK